MEIMLLLKLDCTEAANADKVAEGRKRGGGEKEREKEN
jgi:hypothetical protein